MKKISVLLLVMLLVFICNNTIQAESFKASMGWSKVKTKLLKWPKSGPANKLPAYRHLVSSEEDFISFAHCTDLRYKLNGDKLLTGTSGNLTEFCGDKIEAQLTLPADRREKISFEIFPPDDEEHQSKSADLIQWKVRNPQVLSFSYSGTELIILDVNANGSFFDFGVDRAVVLSAADFTKGEFDPTKVKFLNWELAIQFEAEAFTVFAVNQKGLLLACSLDAEVYTVNIARALAYLNFVRYQVGSEPILLSDQLSNILKLHCSYCAKTSTITRVQDKKSKFYDKKIAKVAAASYVTRASRLEAGIRSALSTLFARNMLLTPELKTLGMVLEEGVFCIGGITAAWEDKFNTSYPLPGQTHVFLRYVPEDPSGFPTGAEAYCGTFGVFGPVGVECTDITVEFKEFTTGKALKLAISHPSKPANEQVSGEFPNNKKGITFIPDTPLQPGTVYVVKVEYKESPKVEEKTEHTWMFQTEENPFK